MSDDDTPAQPETFLVVVPDAPAGQPRRAPKAVEEPRRTLRMTIPAELADELKQAVSVIPGLRLDALLEQALRQVLAEHGAPPPPPPSRRRYNSAVIVIVP
jgi:hypothetical protein